MVGKVPVSNSRHTYMYTCMTMATVDILRGPSLGSQPTGFFWADADWRGRPIGGGMDAPGWRRSAGVRRSGAAGQGIGQVARAWARGRLVLHTRCAGCVDRVSVGGGEREGGRCSAQGDLHVSLSCAVEAREFAGGMCMCGASERLSAGGCMGAPYDVESSTPNGRTLHCTRSRPFLCPPVRSFASHRAVPQRRDMPAQ